MRRTLATALVFVPLWTAACPTPPPPTSTKPATPGSAVILPSPVSAETVPRGDVAPAPTASQ